MSHRLRWSVVLLLMMGFAHAGQWVTTFTQVGQSQSWGPNNSNLYPASYGVTGNTCSWTVDTGGALWFGVIWVPTIGPGGASCSGQIKATLTWAPADGNSILDPPPPVAFVKESATASRHGSSGDCDAGFSDNPNDSTNGPDEDGNTTVVKSSVRYHVKADPGSSFEVTCTPTASVSASSMQGGSASVSYKVEAWPVNLAVGGTTPDPADEDRRKILPGQKVTGAVVYGSGAPLTRRLLLLPAHLFTTPRGRSATVTPSWILS
jgi:hypothetical protein